MDLNFSLSAINEAASQFVKLAHERRVVALHGEMGAGKTTFVHAVCDVLGVKDVVGSPTFSIINEYLTADGQTAYHIDLYRLKNEQEAFSAGVEDCIYSGSWCFVEWPERAPGIFPEGTLHVSIKVLPGDERKLQLNL